MQIHQSAEDYLETILMLSQRMGKVRSIDVVNELGFTKASVSIAMKKLRENGYIAVDGEGNLTLLEPGLEIAQRIYSRHQGRAHPQRADVGKDPRKRPAQRRHPSAGKVIFQETPERRKTFRCLFLYEFFGLSCIFVMDLVQWVCAKKERWKSGKGSDGAKPP